jgi:hypothetical protein
VLIDAATYGLGVRQALVSEDPGTARTRAESLARAADNANGIQAKARALASASLPFCIIGHDFIASVTPPGPQTLGRRDEQAKGSAKVDRTAAVINELVAQRAMMQKQMMDMQPKMMAHMMAHMQDGVMKGMADSMSGCPMMKGSEKPSAPPAEHKH